MLIYICCINGGEEHLGGVRRRQAPPPRTIDPDELRLMRRFGLRINVRAEVDREPQRSRAVLSPRRRHVRSMQAGGAPAAIHQSQ